MADSGELLVTVPIPRSALTVVAPLPESGEPAQRRGQCSASRDAPTSRRCSTSRAADGVVTALRKAPPRRPRRVRRVAQVAGRDARGFDANRSADVRRRRHPRRACSSGPVRGAGERHRYAPSPGPILDARRRARRARQRARSPRVLTCAGSRKRARPIAGWRSCSTQSSVTSSRLGSRRLSF